MTAPLFARHMDTKIAEGTAKAGEQAPGDAPGLFEFPAARLRGLPARFEAQKIAFGPIVFQCVRVAWKSGLLALIDQAGADGIGVEALTGQSSLSGYAIAVVLESALAAGVVRRQTDRYSLTRVGDNILHDDLTQINIDYVHEVCYQGLFLLDDCLRDEKPLGLRTLGDWPTIYQGLSVLPEPARSSWFRFDHYYSDSAFHQALPHVFSHHPRFITDVGANTGKWALQCLHHDADVRIRLLDLPIQLERARAALAAEGLLARAEFHSIDILDFRAGFPANADAVWMSQFLTCFSLEAVGQIFRRAAASLAPGGAAWVLDTFWDRQRYDIASYCLINTSPYFTAIASGNSKMHESSVIIASAYEHGLELAECIDGLGICHSLLRFVRRNG